MCRVSALWVVCGHVHDGLFQWWITLACWSYNRWQKCHPLKWHALAACHSHPLSTRLPVERSEVVREAICEWLKNVLGGRNLPHSQVVSLFLDARAYPQEWIQHFSLFISFFSQVRTGAHVGERCDFKFLFSPKKKRNWSQWIPVCTDHAEWKGSCKLMLLKTNEDISVKHRSCDWQGHMYCFHFAEQPFCLSVSAPSHLNNDVQEHSLACPALCVENHSTRKKTRCSKTTFTSRSAVKWKRILFWLVGLYVTEGNISIDDLAGAPSRVWRHHSFPEK